MDRVVLARQKTIDYAKKNNYTHVFFIDSDVIITKEQFNNIISYNKNIVSGVYNTIGDNGFPHPVPMINNKEYMPFNDFYTGLKEYHKIGFGCVLINVNIFNEINIRCERNMQGKMIKGEDYCFSEDAKKIGEPLYVDTNSQVKHLMRVDFDWEMS